MRRRSIGALAIAVVLFAVVPALAGDDWGDGRTFDGEPSDWRPLDSMMKESDKAAVGADDDDDTPHPKSHDGELKQPVDDDGVQSAPPSD